MTACSTLSSPFTSASLAIISIANSWLYLRNLNTTKMSSSKNSSERYSKSDFIELAPELALLFISVGDVISFNLSEQTVEHITKIAKVGCIHDTSVYMDDEHIHGTTCGEHQTSFEIRAVGTYRQFSPDAPFIGVLPETLELYEVPI